MLTGSRGTNRRAASSDKESVKWYQKAAEQGHADAQYNLGYMYRNGQGVPQSDKEAATWFGLAADQGHANAQKGLSMLKAQQAQTSSNAHPAKSSACAHCGINAPSLKACSRCKITSYCSKECQVAHWKSGHKSDCGKKPYAAPFL